MSVKLAIDRGEEVRGGEKRKEKKRGVKKERGEITSVQEVRDFLLNEPLPSLLI